MKKLNTETRALLERYLNAASNLYGIVPLSKLLSIYNSQNEAISEEQFLNFIDNLELKDKHYAFAGQDEFYENVDTVSPINRDLIAEYLIIDDDYSYYYKVKEHQIGKPYYVPKKEVFLKYEDGFYHEKTLSFISLRAFLRNQPGLTREKADEIVEDIYLTANVCEGNTDHIVSIVNHFGVEFDFSSYKEFIALYTDMFNDTRLHVNCGHTPRELAGIR